MSHDKRKVKPFLFHIYCIYIFIFGRYWCRNYEYYQTWTYSMWMCYLATGKEIHIHITKMKEITWIKWKLACMAKCGAFMDLVFINMHCHFQCFVHLAERDSKIQRSKSVGIFQRLLQVTLIASRWRQMTNSNSWFWFNQWISNYRLFTQLTPSKCWFISWRKHHCFSEAH